MTQRVEYDPATETSVTWTQTFNAENRLATVSDGTDTWTFLYDGDGNRVKQINPDNTVTLFLAGGSYEVEDAAGTPSVTHYYAIAGQRVAMRDATGVKYLLTDHLGSVSAVVDASGTVLSQQRYLPFGGARLDPGVSETDFSFTGQRGLAAAGLMDYRARFYSPRLGRFISPDSIVPGAGNPQAFNRYSYVNNNPIGYIDPSGHDRDCHVGDFYCDTGIHKNPRPKNQVEDPWVPSPKKNDDDYDHNSGNGTDWDFWNSVLGKTWDEIPVEDQMRLENNEGLDKYTWNNSDYSTGGNATDVGGTWQDPAVYLSVALGGALRPAISAAGSALYFKAGVACLKSALCRVAIGASQVYVLGRYPRFIRVAKIIGGTVLNDPAYSDVKQEAFESTIINTQGIIVATNNWNAPSNATSIFAGEITRFMGAGFRTFFFLLLPNSKSP